MGNNVSGIDMPGRELLMNKINYYFSEIKAGSSSEELEKRLKYNIDEYFKHRNKFEKVNHTSTGYSEGSNKIKETRVSKANNPLEAEQASRINNDIITEYNPEVTVFHTAVDKYILSENFEGKRMANADYDTLERHLDNVINIEADTEKTSPILLFGFGNYSREDYNKKLKENLESLKAKHDNVQNDTLNKIMELSPQYMEIATEPAWDIGWLKNAKFNEDGNMKYFDWTKATRLLRIPVYEAVQATYSYGKEISKFRESAMEKYRDYNMEPAVFNELWDLGALYFLTRRIHYSSGRQEASKYKDLLAQEEFKTLSSAMKLSKEISQ